MSISNSRHPKLSNTYFLPGITFGGYIGCLEIWKIIKMCLQNLMNIATDVLYNHFVMLTSLVRFWHPAERNSTLSSQATIVYKYIGNYTFKNTATSPRGQCVNHGPLTRYVKSRVAHAPGIPGTFSPPPQVNDPDMHHGACVTHVPWCMLVLLTRGFLWRRWWGKRSQDSWRIRNAQFYVSDKRPM